MHTYTALLLLPALASAHWQMSFPKERGFDDDKIVQFPCGGFNDVQATRTKYPISGGPIQLSMEHTEVNVEVLIAFGNNPTGDDFHTVLVPTFFERGPQNFCVGDVGTIPNATEGMNATIQVVTNGDPTGGLYGCADVTLTKTPLTSAEFSANCKNSSGTSATPLNTQANANETLAGKGTVNSGGSSSSVSSGLATQATANAMGALAAGVVGLVGIAAAL